MEEAQQAEAEVVRIMAEVTAKAQADAGYRESYLADPKGTLAKAGLTTPDNVKFKVQPVSSISKDYQIKNDDGTVVLVLPEVEEYVQDESMAAAAAASCQSTASTAGTVSTCVSSASTASTKSCT